MAKTLRTARLLVLFPGERFGGAEAPTLRVSDAARALGVELTLAASGALHPALAGSGRVLLNLPLAWRRALPHTARRAQAEAARAALDAAYLDVVLLPLPWPDQAGGAMEALAELGIPTLVACHLAPHGEERPLGLDEEALRAASAMWADWVAVSEPTAARVSRFLDLPPGRVDTVPNAGSIRPRQGDRAGRRAALRTWLGLDADAPVALFRDRLDRAKGADHLPSLAEAFARRTGGVIAGTGTGSLGEKLARASPPGHPLRLLGQHPRPAKLLAAADALVMPSRLEGAPLGFLEAATHDIPVAASPVALGALGPAAGDLAAIADPEDVGAMADALAGCLDPNAPARVRTTRA
ncbi:glycosyltransferase [Roseomonas sp. GCM10028921]